MRFRRIVLTVAGLLVFTSAAWAKKDTVRLTDFAFVPASIVIKAGDTIVWKSTQQCCIAHTTTRTGFFSWNSGPLPLNGTFVKAFPAGGSYDYYCEPHEGIGMTGTINVTTSVPSNNWMGLLLLFASLSVTAIWVLELRRQTA